MNYKAIIKYLFVRKAECRLGLSRTPKASIYALIAVPEKGEPCTVYAGAGAGLPLFARFLAPALVYTDLGSVPVFVTTGELGEYDNAEKWIDEHERNIIPPGVTSDQIVSEFSTFGTAIYAATVLKTVRDNALVPHEKERQIISLSAPLWNIAKLYSKYLKKSFILWRIAFDSSVLGLVNDGCIQRLFNCHISCDDLKGDPQVSAKIIEQYVNKLAQNDSEIPVIVYSPKPDFSMPEGFSLSLYRLQKPPAVNGVPEFCHEAYANAWFGSSEMNFLPSESFRAARRSEIRMHSLRSIVSTGAIATLALLVLLLGADLFLRIVGSHYHGPMERLQTQAAIMKAAETHHRNLLQIFRDKLQFTTERSRVTGLVSDLQTVFPENAWAEEITIALIGRDKYQCDIQAVTPASGLIGTTLENLGKVAGMSDARLVSSEQIRLADGKRDMRFKMKSQWQNIGKSGQKKP
jgi:hypothetical protein